MTTKQAAPSAAKPNDILTPKEPTATGKALSQTIASAVPRVKISNNELSFDHPDRKVGEQRMMQALGTTDSDFMYGILRQLANAASSQGQQADETDLNFMVSAVVGHKPRDQFEAMLLAQNTAVHVAIMRSANYLANTENIYQQDSGERVLNKLARTFLTQMDGLKRYRTVGEQTVTVQHVQVQDGGQAIVGNVTQHAPATASDKMAVSPAAITDARVVPMEILGEREHEPVPSRSKSDT